MDEALLLAIVAALHAHDGQSDHQLCKTLGIGMSQLNRALATLATFAAQGGPTLVRCEPSSRRRTLWLTESGRELCPKS